MDVHKGTVTRLHALGVALILFAPAPFAVADECAAWPGEATPLPTTRSADAFESRWAQLRASELERLASALEAQDPGTAYRVWRHVGCLDPDRASAKAVNERLRPTILVAARPARREPPAPIVPAPRPASAPALAEKTPAPVAPEKTPEKTPVALNTPAPKSSKAPAPVDGALGPGSIDVAARPPTPPVAPPPAPAPSVVPAPEAPVDLSGVDTLLREAQDVLIEARFRDVLDSTDVIRTQLRSMGTSPGVMERRARIEIMAATAQIALGRAADAAQSFARALEADPQLKLSDSTPPKIRRMLEEVRSERGGEARP